MGIEPMTSSPAWYLLNHWAKEVLSDSPTCNVAITEYHNDVQLTITIVFRNFACIFTWCLPTWFLVAIMGNSFGQYVFVFSWGFKLSHNSTTFYWWGDVSVTGRSNGFVHYKCKSRHCVNFPNCWRSIIFTRVVCECVMYCNTLCYSCETAREGVSRHP